MQHVQLSSNIFFLITNFQFKIKNKKLKIKNKNKNKNNNSIQLTFTGLVLCGGIDDVFDDFLEFFYYLVGL